MLTLDPESPTPPFEQIKLQVSALRASGELGAGYRLPPVRQLAEDLGLAPNTVAKAYRELEAEGIIETRGRKGSFVTGTDESRHKEALAAAHDYLDRTRALGLRPVDAADLVRDLADGAGPGLRP